MTESQKTKNESAISTLADIVAHFDDEILFMREAYGLSGEERVEELHEDERQFLKDLQDQIILRDRAKAAILLLS